MKNVISCTVYTSTKNNSRYNQGNTKDAYLPFFCTYEQYPPENNCNICYYYQLTITNIRLSCGSSAIMNKYFKLTAKTIECKLDDSGLTTNETFSLYII